MRVWTLLYTFYNTYQTNIVQCFMVCCAHRIAHIAYVYVDDIVCLHMYYVSVQNRAQASSLFGMVRMFWLWSGLPVGRWPSGLLLPIWFYSHIPPCLSQSRIDNAIDQCFVVVLLRPWAKSQHLLATTTEWRIVWPSKYSHNFFFQFSHALSLHAMFRECYTQHNIASVCCLARTLYLLPSIILIHLRLTEHIYRIKIS